MNTKMVQRICRQMKTKPITLILTLLFCLSGSVFGKDDQYKSFERVEKINKKEADEYCKIPFQNFKDESIIFYTREISTKGKPAPGNRYIKPKLLRRDLVGLLRIQNSTDKNFKYSIYSYHTGKEEIFLKELKCVNMNKFTYNKAIANAVWKGEVFNAKKEENGYYEVRLGTGSALIKPNPSLISLRFFNKANSRLGTIELRTHSPYEPPKYKLIKNKNGIEIPFVSNSRGSGVHKFFGSINHFLPQTKLK
jgi:hypothetical protein